MTFAAGFDSDLAAARNATESTSGDWLAGSPMDPAAVGLEPLPTISGFPFLHAGMAANIAGPTGGGRSYLIEACLYDAALAGGHCLYLGDEVTEDEFNARAAEITKRRSEQVDDELRAALSNCRYLDLPTTLAQAWKQPKQWAAAVSAHGYEVVVLDPLSSAAQALGLNFNNDGPEYLEFYGKLIQPLRAAGIATVSLDNMGYDERAQKRAKGVSEKGHKADLTFWCKALEEPTGLLLTADKVRATRCAHKRGDRWQILKYEQRLTHIGPDHHDEPPPFRPTFLMEKVSRFLEAQTEALARNAVLRALPYKTANVDKALNALVDDGFVDRSKHGQAHKHKSLHPYRKNDNRDPETQPSPNRDPDSVRDNRVHRVPPEGDSDSVSVNSDSVNNRNRVPRTDDQLQTLIDQDERGGVA